MSDDPKPRYVWHCGSTSIMLTPEMTLRFRHSDADCWNPDEDEYPASDLDNIIEALQDAKATYGAAMDAEREQDLDNIRKALQDARATYGAAMDAECEQENETRRQYIATR